MWVRGLKLVERYNISATWLVAPHVGAWIETAHPLYKKGPKNVAPHVGAWIETGLSQNRRSGDTRRTPCGCVD